jgi:hypothetical protein
MFCRNYVAMITPFKNNKIDEKALEKIIEFQIAGGVDGIVPCGIQEEGLGVTSLVDLGYPVTFAEVDEALRQTFIARFGAVSAVDAPA